MSILLRLSDGLLNSRMKVRIIGILLASIAGAIFCVVRGSQVPHYDSANWKLTQLSAKEVFLLLPRVLFVDARNQAEFASSPIPGALSLSPDEWDSRLAAFLDVWTPDRIVVVYCGGQACGLSKQVALKLLRDLPGAKLFVLKGGFPAWQAYQAQSKPALSP